MSPLSAVIALLHALDDEEEALFDQQDVLTTQIAGRDPGIDRWPPFVAEEMERLNDRLAQISAEKRELRDLLRHLEREAA